MSPSITFNQAGIIKRREETLHSEKAGEMKNLITSVEGEGEGEEEAEISQTSKITNLHQRATSFKEVAFTNPTMREVEEGEGGGEGGGGGGKVLMMVVTPINHQDLQLDTAWVTGLTRS